MATPSLNHWKVAPVVVEAAVNVTEPPAQKVVGPPAVIVGTAGIGFTVIVNPAEAVLEQRPDVATAV